VGIPLRLWSGYTQTCRHTTRKREENFSGVADDGYVLKALSIYHLLLQRYRIENLSLVLEMAVTIFF